MRLKSLIEVRIEQNIENLLLCRRQNRLYQLRNLVTFLNWWKSIPGHFYHQPVLLVQVDWLHLQHFSYYLILSLRRYYFPVLLKLSYFLFQLITRINFCIKLMLKISHRNMLHEHFCNPCTDRCFLVTVLLRRVVKHCRIRKFTQSFKVFSR